MIMAPRRKEEQKKKSNPKIKEYSPGPVADSVDSANEIYDDVVSDDEIANKHRLDLKSLEKIDPEFHKFLQENDKGLLEFDSSASEDEDTGENDELHEPPESLEVASDASDYEDDSAAEVYGKITQQMVAAWEKELSGNKQDMKHVRVVVRAFHACLVRVSGDSEDGAGVLRVDGSAVFNSVVRLCVTSLYPYLQKMMKLPNKSVTKKHVEKSKKWPYAKNVLRSYLVDLFKLLNNVSSEDIQRVLLKHLHQMIPFVACLPTISKAFLKQVISLWSSNNDDTVRVVSFLCLLRYAAADPNTYLDSVLKKMYMSYVANSKFVSVNSLPAINFLRKSLAEMFSLNETIAYNHAFLYIRQLAIYLRAAVTLKKKDSIQTVYSWQFISSLWLWVDVLCSMREKPQMNSLIYPTIQIIMGCIKLVPTAQYFPLRFHCIQMLIKLSREVDVFIPVLPFLVEALSILNKSTKHKKISMRPMDFTYILRLSKSQMQENAFRDAVVENIYDCLLQYTASESYRISFPDTVVLLQVQVKQFLKECKNANYSKKLKPLLEKIDEVAKMMSAERSKCGIALSDKAGIAAWESNMKVKSNSLMNFYESWRKIQAQKTTRKIIDDLQFGEHELPVLKKLPGKEKKNEVLKKKNDRVVLFDSDMDDDDDDDEQLTFSASKRRRERV